MTGDPAFYERALARMDRIAMVLGASAVLVFFVFEGWRGALGCAFTSIASIYNLRRLKRIAYSLGAPAGEPSNSWAAIALGFRYLLLGGICFVIIKFLGVSLPAIFTGLLVTVAAVLVEIIYELLFIR